MLFRNWVGRPFGENCWQFIVEHYLCELGIELWPYLGVLRGSEGRQKLARFLGGYFNSHHWCEVFDVKYPDVAIFDVKGFAIHGGIVLGGGKLLHMKNEGSSVQSYVDGSMVRDKFGGLVGVYRYML